MDFFVSCPALASSRDLPLGVGAIAGTDRRTKSVMLSLSGLSFTDRYLPSVSSLW